MGRKKKNFKDLSKNKRFTDKYIKQYENDYHVIIRKIESENNTKRDRIIRLLEILENKGYPIEVIKNIINSDLNSQ